MTAHTQASRFINCTTILGITACTIVQAVV